MGFPFLCICGFMYLFGINRSWVKSYEFWLLFIFGFLVISFQRSFFYHYYFIDELKFVDRLFVRKVFWWFRPFLTTFIPLVIFYAVYEKKKDKTRSWYGLATHHTDFKPYVLLCMIVFAGMWVASYISDLAEYYPRYLVSGGPRFAKAHKLDEWVTTVIYEIVYGFNFLSVELFFRGFLVLGFARVLGGHAVLAMVGAYVFLHFSKPLTECISSAFGGYLLGILTFYTYRIWGGVILHVALAWSMELFAWMQKASEQ